MTKDKLRQLIDKYKKAEKLVLKMDDDYGINIWNSRKENFYNMYNDIIFKLFKEIYGSEKKDLLEDYIFEQIDITFDELYENLENHE